MGNMHDRGTWRYQLEWEPAATAPNMTVYRVSDLGHRYQWCTMPWRGTDNLEDLASVLDELYRATLEFLEEGTAVN